MDGEAGKQTGVKHRARKDGDTVKWMGGSPTAAAACSAAMAAPAARIWLGRRRGRGNREAGGSEASGTQGRGCGEADGRLSHRGRGMLGGHGDAGRANLTGEEARTRKPRGGRERSIGHARTGTTRGSGWERSGQGKKRQTFWLFTMVLHLVLLCRMYGWWPGPGWRWCRRSSTGCGGSRGAARLPSILCAGQRGRGGSRPRPPQRGRGADGDAYVIRERRYRHGIFSVETKYYSVTVTTGGQKNYGGRLKFSQFSSRDRY